MFTALLPKLDRFDAWCLDMLGPLHKTESELGIQSPFQFICEHFSLPRAYTHQGVMRRFVANIASSE